VSRHLGCGMSQIQLPNNLELAALGVLALNMLQAVYAIKYPRAPLPPLPSPARPKGISSPPAITKRRFKALSPNVNEICSIQSLFSDPQFFRQAPSNKRPFHHTLHPPSRRLHACSTTRSHHPRHLHLTYLISLRYPSPLPHRPSCQHIGGDI
jgi:hypothetical protein